MTETESRPTPPYQRDADTVLSELGSSLAQGLDEATAKERLASVGPNELIERGGRTLWQILWEQVSSAMIVVLIVAGVLAFFFKGEGSGVPADSIAIFAIVVLFVVLGVLQEYRAQRAIAALKKMSAPTVRVRRGGALAELSGRELVPGDLVQLETGAVVPADCRIVESVNLRVQEAALTGESEAIEKTARALPGPELPLGDRRNMGYMGTFVSYGRGTAVVVSTGMQTELGKIASLFQGVRHEPTPLTRKLDSLGKTLAIVAVVVSVLVGLTGLAEGKEVGELLILGISIAVAVVPEGLPAVLTFTLALGAQRMLRKNALIRKLPAVETLGSVTVICSDKTGTLTQNRMTVTALWTLDGESTLDSEPWELSLPEDSAAQWMLVTGGVLCSDATLDSTERSGVGDPTEVALVVAARRYGSSKSAVENAYPRVHEYAFDSERKLMTTVHRISDSESIFRRAVDTPLIAITKGASDQLLDRCSHAIVEGRAVVLTGELRERIQEANSAMVNQGRRVLGVALRAMDAKPESLDPGPIERELVFGGLVGMIDPPRPEARDAVAKCKSAGIRTIMITGDHPDTARSIAADLGLAERGARAVTGLELDRMSSSEVDSALREVNVFARVSPEHKLVLVTALQRAGEIVAMTGDGVNDAPALRKADIGVAMGITGTDVAKEAADMVLVDDNFATIVAAVQEGRVVFDNLRRFIMFSLTGNLVKVLVVAVPPLLGMVAMLKPIQILFSNLLTDGLLGLGMGVEAAERDTMRRPPYRPDEGVFGRGAGKHVALLGPLIGLVMLGVGCWQWWTRGIGALEGEARHQAVLGWGTLMFTTMALMQLSRAFASRSFRDPFWRSSLAKNPVLVTMMASVIVLQLLAVYVPALHEFFATVPLSGADLALGLGVAVAVLVVMEAEKWWVARGSMDRPSAKSGAPRDHERAAR